MVHASFSYGKIIRVSIHQEHVVHTTEETYCCRQCERTAEIQNPSGNRKYQSPQEERCVASDTSGSYSSSKVALLRMLALVPTGAYTTIHTALFVFVF